MRVINHIAKALILIALMLLPLTATAQSAGSRDWLVGNNSTETIKIIRTVLIAGDSDDVRVQFISHGTCAVYIYYLYVYDLDNKQYLDFAGDRKSFCHAYPLFRQTAEMSFGSNNLPNASASKPLRFRLVVTAVDRAGKLLGTIYSPNFVWDGTTMKYE